jgi:putative hemolysin
MRDLQRSPDFGTIAPRAARPAADSARKGSAELVNIHEPGPFEGLLQQWPVLATTGALELRLAETEGDVEAAQRLRFRVFYEEMSAIPSPAMREHRRDYDRFDQYCDHILVVDRAMLDDEGQPAVVGTYRLMRDSDARRCGGFYTSGEYNISGLLAAGGESTRLLELGRSCVLKSHRAKPATMQLLWRGVMVCVARFSIDTLFGCASLPGIDPDALAIPLSYLHHYHGMQGPDRVRARNELYVNMNRMEKDAIDVREARRALPPLIKGYLRAGAQIGDGAVVDRQFGTTDVLIYLPVARIEWRYRHRFGATP